ncbi:14849_t:CDS:2 [Gigaspora margarita]|uniref:14849_t:CDS:1 n=1 Tax=Gigaspora margarita TaxID=4874 RepID=A0ABN7WEH3_GIGMA|nr:14849_t:CDS:2 [Gigaspora margarita]
MVKTKSNKCNDYKRPLPKLSKETLSEVFRHLVDQDLWVCLRVCREWFEVGVKILWEDPLSWGYPVINVYIDFLNAEQRKSLKNARVTLPKLHNPMDDYSLYIKKFNLSELHDAIFSWLLHTENIDEKFRDLFKGNFNAKAAEKDDATKPIMKMMTLLISQIIKLLFNSTQGLEMLDMSFNHLSVGIPSDVVKSAEAMKRAFTDLTWLRVHTNFTSKLISEDRLDTAIKIFNKMVELFNQQKKLKHFTIRRSDLLFNHMVSIGEHAASTLVSFNLSGISMSPQQLQPLTRCSQLSTLSFVRCTDIKQSGKNKNKLRDDGAPTFIDSSGLFFLSVKKIYLYKNKISPETLKSLIKMTMNLEELIIVNNNTEAIINAISCHCGNINYLALTLHSDTTFVALMDWLSLSHLKTLVLSTHHSKIINFKDRPNQSLGSMLYEIGDQFPLSLTSFDVDFEVTPQQLDIFLQRSNYVFEELGLHQSSGLRDDHLKLLMNHAKVSGRLHKVTFDRIYWSSPDENLESLISFEGSSLEKSYFSPKLLSEAEKFINTINSTSVDPFIDPLQENFRTDNIETMDIDDPGSE